MVLHTFSHFLSLTYFRDCIGMNRQQKRFHQRLRDCIGPSLNMQMLSRIKTSLTPRKQVRLRDDPKKIGDRTASTTIHTANKVCDEMIYQSVPIAHVLMKTSFNNIGTSGKVTNIAGHVIHGDLNVYNTDSTASALIWMMYSHYIR